MEDILKKLSEHAVYRVETAKKEIPISEVRALAESLTTGDFPFTKALAKPELSFICEVKKASPSKGIIAQEFPYLEIAKDYEAAGADCISVLTEPKWFLGNLQYLEEISKTVKTPTLRKDFTVDPYMIYEAKAKGASAILLICAILDDKQLSEYLQIAKSLGLSVITEAHTEAEIEMALKAGAPIIGVNNRNLKTFSVDNTRAGNMRSLVPKDILFISESGMQNETDVALAKGAGADAVLIGEALMRAPDKKIFLQSLKAAALNAAL